jgi:PAS domain S-box-containing protein
MADGDGIQGESSELRRRDLLRLLDRLAESGTLPQADAYSLIHELQVHQIELELQNEELRRAQEELAMSHARYFDLFDLAPVGYLTLDAAGLIEDANLAAAQLVGLERQQIVGQPFVRFISREDRDLYYLHHRDVSDGPATSICELRLRRPDSQDCWVRMQSVGAPGNVGSRACRVTLSDITDRKQADAALKRSYADLDRKVQERTAELGAANQALRQSRDELRLLTRRLVEVQETERRTIARELHDSAGQALTLILMGLDSLVRDHDDAAETEARLRKLRQTVEDLSAELHALSANLHPPVLERVGLVSALGGLLDSLQETGGPHFGFQTWGLEGRRLPAEHELAVYRVAQEAIHNALRHSQADNIGVVVQLRDNNLQVTIEDDGIGFDVGVDTHARHPEGGGLGLISMRERMEMVAGALTIESSPGAGTTVFVEVPL